MPSFIAGETKLGSKTISNTVKQPVSSKQKKKQNNHTEIYEIGDWKYGKSFIWSSLIA